MKAGGLCVGASNISFVELIQKDNKIRVVKSESLAHEGNPREAISRLLEGGLFGDADYLGVTGRKYRNIIHAAIVSEPEAMEEGYRFLKDEGYNADAIISVGGETFMVYTLDDGPDQPGDDGEQMRLRHGGIFSAAAEKAGLGLEEALAAGEGASPYEVSGSCSVFCKSDCTHALNKGAPRGHRGGLCRMMALKSWNCCRAWTWKRPCSSVGWLQNQVMLNFLKKTPGPGRAPHAHSFEALGAALWALQGKKAKPPLTGKLLKTGSGLFPPTPPRRTSWKRVHFAEMEGGTPQEGDACILGLDVGSTTTKAVLIRRRTKPCWPAATCGPWGTRWPPPGNATGAAKQMAPCRGDPSAWGLRAREANCRPPRPNPCRHQRDHRPRHGGGPL
jgi:activator of 2-hydroxyglutaryl-CoA dehydratase